METELVSMAASLRDKGYLKEQAIKNIKEAVLVVTHGAHPEVDLEQSTVWPLFEKALDAAVEATYANPNATSEALQVEALHTCVILLHRKRSE